MPVLTLATPPTAEAITLAAAKAYLRVDANDEDVLIGDQMLPAATRAVEGFTGMSLVATGWLYQLDCFPLCHIRLPRWPIFSAGDVAITYIDDQGAEQTLDPAEYQVSLGNRPLIRPAYNKTWPSTRRELNAVRVAFTAGWAAPTDIPRDALAALHILVGQFYECRGDDAGEMPISVRFLLAPYMGWS